MLDPYSSKYKTLKTRILKNELKNSIHAEFCSKLENLYQSKILDCEITRMSHNEKLRLEVFVYDEHDVKRIDNSTWDKISINKISLLREEYKKEIERNSRLWNLMNILNVNDKEIDQLFVIVSPFLPCLRWDLNINLDKEVERSFFKKILEDDDFKILKEFEMLLILTNKNNIEVIKKNDTLKAITKKYTDLLISFSPIKNIFSNEMINIYLEEEENFITKYGNLKNYLN